MHCTVPVRVVSSIGSEIQKSAERSLGQAKHSAAQQNTAQHRKVQKSTAQHRKVQPTYSTTQHSYAQQLTIRHVATSSQLQLYLLVCELARPEFLTGGFLA